MLVTGIFFFSHNVFKSLLFEGHCKSGLCCKELSVFSVKFVICKSFNLDKAKILFSCKERIKETSAEQKGTLTKVCGRQLYQ